MSITIESPTAEAVWQAIQQLPGSEMERLRELLNAPDNVSTHVNESSEWSDEDIEDFRRSSARLIEKRLGAEEHLYD